jgi:Tol biopolymer transport system component
MPTIVLLHITNCVQKYNSPVLKGSYLGRKPPGMTPEVFAPGIISRAGFHLHSCLAFSPDGNEIYFTKMVFEPVRQGTIYYMKQEENEWTGPRIASFSGVYSDDSPAFSPDGKKLYFSSTRPTVGTDETDDLNFWLVEKTDAGWSEPKYAGAIFNTDYCDFRLSISQKGNVYLSSDRNYMDGRTFDIFVSELNNGQYTIPKIISDAITTPITEQIGFIAPDESYIVFYRYPRTNPDSVGLYISFRTKDGSWTNGVNMGDSFNSPAESCTQAASLSPDGKHIFFLRRYDEAIYWVDAKIIEDLKPEGL